MEGKVGGERGKREEMKGESTDINHSISLADTIFQAPWFLPAVAGGGGGVLALIIVVVSCCCCCYCCSHRKMKVTLNENAGVWWAWSSDSTILVVAPI